MEALIAFAIAVALIAGVVTVFAVLMVVVSKVEDWRRWHPPARDGEYPE